MDQTVIKNYDYPNFTDTVGEGKKRRINFTTCSVVLVDLIQQATMCHRELTMCVHSPICKHLMLLSDVKSPAVALS